MSIKTIGSNVTSNSKGLEKRINKGAERLVFDILQSSQYSTPISSSVRELTTNALDSQREKEMAIEILTGNKSIEDYYIKRDGEQYQDSNFDPSYYNLEYLDNTQSDVILKYHENEGVGFCDEFIVEDYGVGIGGKRLIGMSELGYSTKRNTSENFGAFGLGSKVALSTGVDFYVVESAYNGKYVKFQCFAYKTVFTISKWEADGEMNLEGNTIYYKNYLGNNFTRVSFGVKRHNRSAFQDAVSDQLTYVQGVKFFIRRENNTSYFEADFYKEPIYNSKNILVSEGTYYGRPHIVIVKSEDSSTGINYGHVQFRELEMEQLFGAVGLKCPMRQAYIDENNNEVVIQEGVEVTPSREKVIWNDNTKRFVENVIDKAHIEISELVNSELGNETDILEWLKKCSVTINSGNRVEEITEETTSIALLGKLSRFLNVDKIKPKFFLDKSIEYKGTSNLLPYYTITKVFIPFGLSTIKVSDVYYWNHINLDNLYFLPSNRNITKDWYLLNEIKTGEKAIYILRENTSKLNGVNPFMLLNETFIATRALEDKILNYIKLSKYYKSYEDVVVPSDFKLPTGATASFVNILTPEQMREMNGEIVAFTLREDQSRYSKELVFDKIQPIQKDFLTSSTPTYYGLRDDKEELYVAYKMLENINPVYSSSRTYGYIRAFYWDKPPVRLEKSDGLKLIERSSIKHKAQIIKISEKTENIVHANSNIKHVSNLFWEDNGDGTMVLHPLLKFYFTREYSSMVRDWVSVYISKIIPEFTDICFVITSLFEQSPQFSYDEVRNSVLLDNLTKFAKRKYFLDKSLPDYKEQLQGICEEIFKLDIKDIDIFYDDILEISTFVCNFAEGINSFVGKLHVNNDISSAFLIELESYLKMRGKLDMEIPSCLPSAVAIIHENLIPQYKDND